MKKFEEYLVKRIDKNKNYEGLLEYPSYVEIETVNACNARCPMCTINDWNRNYPIMKDNVFNKVSDDLFEKLSNVPKVKNPSRIGNSIHFYGRERNVFFAVLNAAASSVMKDISVNKLGLQDLMDAKFARDGIH